MAREVCRSPSLQARKASACRRWSGFRFAASFASPSSPRTVRAGDEVVRLHPPPHDLLRDLEHQGCSVAGDPFARPHRAAVDGQAVPEENRIVGELIEEAHRLPMTSLVLEGVKHEHHRLLAVLWRSPRREDGREECLRLRGAPRPDESVGEPDALGQRRLKDVRLAAHLHGLLEPPVRGQSVRELPQGRSRGPATRHLPCA